MKKAIPKGATSDERRKARLGEALRNNLALRKARSRAAKPGEDGDSHLPENPDSIDSAAPDDSHD